MVPLAVVDDGGCDDLPGGRPLVPELAVELAVGADVQRGHPAVATGAAAGQRGARVVEQHAARGVARRHVEPHLHRVGPGADRVRAGQLDVRRAAVELGRGAVRERPGRAERHRVVGAQTVLDLVVRRGGARRVTEAPVPGRRAAQHRRAVDLAGAGDRGLADLPDAAVLVGDLADLRRVGVVGDRGELLARGAGDAGQQAAGLLARRVLRGDLGGRQALGEGGDLGDGAVEVRRVAGVDGGGVVRLVRPLAAEETGSDVGVPLEGAGVAAAARDHPGTGADRVAVQVEALGGAGARQHHLVPVAVVDGARDDRGDAAGVPELGVQPAVRVEVDRRRVLGGAGPAAQRQGGVGEQHAGDGRGGLEPHRHRVLAGAAGQALGYLDVGGRAVEAGAGRGAGGQRSALAERDVAVRGLVGALVGVHRAGRGGRAGCLGERPERGRAGVQHLGLELRTRGVAVLAAGRRVGRRADLGQLVAGVGVVPVEGGAPVAPLDGVGVGVHDVRTARTRRGGPVEVQRAVGNRRGYAGDLAGGPVEVDGAGVGVGHVVDAVGARAEALGEGVDGGVLVGERVPAGDRPQGREAARRRRECAVGVPAEADLRAVRVGDHHSGQVAAGVLALGDAGIQDARPAGTEGAGGPEVAGVVLADDLQRGARAADLRVGDGLGEVAGGRVEAAGVTVLGQRGGDGRLRHLDAQ